MRNNEKLFLNFNLYGFPHKRTIFESQEKAHLDSFLLLCLGILSVTLVNVIEKFQKKKNNNNKSEVKKKTK